MMYSQCSWYSGLSVCGTKYSRCLEELLIVFVFTVCCSGHLVCGLHHGWASHWTDSVSWHWSYPSHKHPPPLFQACLLSGKAASEALIDLLAAKTSLAQTRASVSPPYVNAVRICDLFLFLRAVNAISRTHFRGISRGCFKICHNPSVVPSLPRGNSKKNEHNSLQ